LYGIDEVFEKIEAGTVYLWILLRMIDE